MKTKVLAIALLSTLSMGAMAQSAFEGFFGQIGLGYEATSPNLSNGSTGGVPYTISNENKSGGLGGTISIGSYFSVTNSFLLGLGAEYSPIATSNADWTMNLPSESNVHKFKKKNSYNIFLSPALAIDKAKLAYLKVGYTGMSAQTTALDNIQDTYNFSGYSLGIGYKQIISGGLYGFAESNYSSYGSKGLSEATGNLKPKTMNVLLGLGYKF
nr:outer membrane beta-barrel protein [uncultured Polynucleobacter sp.]